VTTVCSFERVFLILIFCMDRVLFSSQNASFIIQVWRGFLLLKGGMQQVFVHIDQ
jgi:hypothetical protein